MAPLRGRWFWRGSLFLAEQMFLVLFLKRDKTQTIGRISGASPRPPGSASRNDSTLAAIEAFVKKLLSRIITDISDGDY